MLDTVPPPRAPSGDRGRRWSRARRPKVVAASVLVLAATTGAAAWWTVHPDDVFDRGYGLDSSRDPGTTLWASLAHVEREHLTGVVVTGLSPQVTRDTADSSVEYLVCVLDTDYLADQGVGAFPLGGRDADLDRYCSSTRPAIGATLGLGGRAEEVLVGITPHHKGRSVVADHRVDYRIGWQRGHATIDVTTDVRSPQQPVRPLPQAPRPSR